jgi:hypothetical protein
MLAGTMVLLLALASPALAGLILPGVFLGVASAALGNGLPTAFEGARCTTVEHHVFTPMRSDLRLAKDLVSTDREAFEKLMAAGRAGVFRGGVEVVVMERDVIEVQVRLKGDLLMVWTGPTALNCPEK